MRTDLGVALRSLAKAPAFTAVTTLTLGLGIGANAAIVGLFDTLLLRPPAGIAEPASLVAVSTEMPGRPGLPPMISRWLSWPQFQALHETRAVLAGVAAYTSELLPVGTEAGSPPEMVVFASDDYFAALGAATVLGQPIGPAHDRPGAPEPVAVIGFDYWQRALGGDPDVLGTVITVKGHPLTIIGVAQRRFTGVRLGSPAVWVPLNLASSLGYGVDAMRSPAVSWLSVVARLAPGSSHEQASASIQAALLGAAEANRGVRPSPVMGTVPGNAIMRIGGPPDGAAPPTPRVILGKVGGAAAEGPRGEAPVQLWYLAVAAAVLLIACANVANLLLARGISREHALAVRVSLGATRARMARLLLAESVVLGALGGVVGIAIAVAIWGTLPSFVQLPPLPAFLGYRTFLLTAALVLTTVLLFGIVPLARLTRPDLNRLLTGGSPRISGGNVGRGALIVTQFAISVVLMVTAGLFLRSYQSVQNVDLGFEIDGLLLASADTRAAQWSPERNQAFWDEVEERVREIPGVTDVSRGSIAPYSMIMMVPYRGDASRALADTPPEPVNTNYVGERFFETLGVSIVEGRSFADVDRAAAAPVAVVSRSFARREFPGVSPIGRCVYVEMDGTCIEVIGVADDARLSEVTDDAPRFVYRPIDPATTRSLGPTGSFLHVRTSGDPSILAAAVRAEIEAVAGNGVAVNVRRMSELLEPQLAPWRSSAILLSAFGAVGTLLAAIGLYGVVTFLIERRTREIGIRLALGARQSSILTLVFTETGRLIAIATALGLIGSFFAARSFAGLLYGVGTFDPLTFAGTLFLLAIVAFTASGIPARRAAAVDPVIALRNE